MGSWIGPAVTATLISSLIAIISWIVNWRISRHQEYLRRKERIRDVQTALLAEIRSSAHHLGQYDAKELLSTVSARLASNDSYVPFVPREPGSPLYSAISGEISILPTQVIDPVVLFYRQQEVIAHFANDLRGDKFVAMPNEQKLQMLEDFLNLRNFAEELAHDAIQRIRESLDINRSGEDLSGPISASGGA